MRRLLALLGAFVLLALPASAQPSPERLAALSRGVNLTNWFRFPARTDRPGLRDHLSDAAMADLRRAGFSFVRLAVQPEFVLSGGQGVADALGEAIARLQAQGLAVLIELHPQSWHLETSAEDRARLMQAWRIVAPLLARRDPRSSFAELVNEPVFAGDATGWAALQAGLLGELRRLLPETTLVATGNDWGSLDGLLRLAPLGDQNVVYSFHFYEPVLLTTLGAFEPGLDRAALARLPFPVAPGCAAAADTVEQARTRDVMRWYCTTQFDPGAAIARAGDWARRNHAAVLLGEFGAAAALNAPARLAWLAEVRRAAEHEGIGWALWGYEDSMGFGASGARPALAATLLEALDLRKARGSAPRP